MYATLFSGTKQTRIEIQDGSGSILGPVKDVLIDHKYIGKLVYYDDDSTWHAMPVLCRYFRARRDSLRFNTVEDALDYMCLSMRLMRQVYRSPIGKGIGRILDYEEHPRLGVLRQICRHWGLGL